MDSNAVFAILLLLVGIGILAAEVFIPTGGLLGVITFLTLSVSVLFAYRAWGTSNPNIFWSFCGILLLLVPTSLATAFYILPRTAAGKRILLEAPDPGHLTPFVEETDRLTRLVGRFGTTATPLTPGGMVLVDGERFHAFSEGLIVESGESIEVIGVRGTRLLIRPGQPRPQSDVFRVDPTQPGDRSSDALLDFELPQS